MDARRYKISLLVFNSTSDSFAAFWKITSVGKDQVNKEGFCILKIMPIVCFCSVSTRFFIMRLGANTLYDIYSGIVDPFYFHSLVQLFLSIKGYCVYTINKIIHGRA